MSLVKVSEMTNKQINYLVAQLEGRVLRDPIAATHSDVEHLAVPFTLYEVNCHSDGDGNNHSADVTPIKVTRYGVNHAAGATAPSISFTDHQGRKALGTLDNYFFLESEAQLEASAFVKGTLEEFDPCVNWEDCMPIVSRWHIGLLCSGNAYYEHLGGAFYSYGATSQIALMRAFITMNFGEYAELPEGEV